MARINFHISAFLRKEYEDYKLLLRSIPSLVVTCFVVSVIAMNLLANKELIRLPWLTLDCGFALSWISFLTMDCVCKRFGGRAATQLAIIAICINLLTFFLFKLLCLLPSNWSAFYDGIIGANEALNSTIGGSSWIVLGSALAMLVSSIVNSLTNMGVAKLLNGNQYREFAIRSFTSTILGQFVDNLVFAVVVSIPLFGWSMRQAFFCSVTAAVFELLMEILFSGFGYRLARQWEKENVGSSYLEHHANCP